MQRKKEVEGLPLFQQCGDHSHFVGLVDGVIYQPGDDPKGEVMFDTEEASGKSTVGGGNPKYNTNYEKLDWNN